MEEKGADAEVIIVEAAPQAPPREAPQSEEPPTKKPKFKNPKLLKTNTEGLTAGGRLPGTPRTPRIAREVSPSNALLNLSARQLAKKEQEAVKEEERRKRAENEEAVKAQRKAARQAALEHKEEETRSAEELANQVVWAKLSTYPWWPAQIVDPSSVHARFTEGRKSDNEVLARFFGTYDYGWVDRRTNVSDLDHKFKDRQKLTKKKQFLKALEEAEECRKTGALPEAWTAPFEEPEAEEEMHIEEPPEANGHVEEASPPEAMAAKERKRKGKAHAVEDKPKAERRARQLRVMRHLGLVPPEGSPFTHESGLAAAVR
ncbi:hypothetical protein KFL_004990020 [Klebsormidium nitens]|uniref:PWWP domain-containing protein n=1 Tax=Klebsormidium nitens TaxID=105231 RepID=A0A1Y1IKL4_KLENI|nr:hypothetical protein KFL_004990020 [Klebsormidium nitens]|eukprot:GAQ89217.1 hypothetical protein KFL_004990020 [Klebsormidium nitens]